MACLVRNRSNFYKKIQLDIWAYYTTYTNELSTREKLDGVVGYWCRVRMLSEDFRSFKRKRYVYRLWKRTRYKFPKKLKEEYIVPRYLKGFYMILKKKTFVKYIEMSRKGKMVRGFLSTFIGLLEGRLFIVVYRLNLITNIFIIKSMINQGIFQVNLKNKKHINTPIKLGDLIQVEARWKKLILHDMIFRVNQGIICRNISNYYTNYEKLHFVLYKVYKIEDIHYPINIDIYRAIDFIGPLR